MAITLSNLYEDDLRELAALGTPNIFSYFYRKIFRKHYTVKIPEHTHRVFRRDLSVYQGFGCPKCYKHIDLKTISMDCPFCDTTHKYEFDWWRSFPKTMVKVPITELHMLIFSECTYCKGELIKIYCPHCNGEIDLTEEWNPGMITGGRNFVMRGYEK